MSNVQVTIAPHTQRLLVQHTHPTDEELNSTLDSALSAQREWARCPLADRIEVGRRFVDELKKMSEEFPLELTQQMGRPVSQTPGELRGTISRAEYLLSIAQDALAPFVPLLPSASSATYKTQRKILRVPHRLIFTIAPWNYPYLTTINSLVPALLAGSSIILKPSPQTPLTGERLALALSRAGLPRGVFQVLHLSNEQAEKVVRDPRVEFVVFTGSVATGRKVQRAAAEGEGFKGVVLELGGKDPAYVRPDADFEYTVNELVDGAFFNAGQSCCAVERIYVHESIYDKFVKAYVEVVKRLKLGDPTDPEMTLGPVVNVASAEKIRRQIADAIAAGAKPLISEDAYSIAKPGSAYVAPQVLVNVNHSMDIMKEETFGPVIGIMRVSSDAEALQLMNDTAYGLTASIWTNAEANPESLEAFEKFMEGLDVGSVLLNQCDYLDPALAHTGQKNSGRGVSLSKLAFDQLTRAKSVFMKIMTTT